MIICPSVSPENGHKDLLAEKQQWNKFKYTESNLCCGEQNEHPTRQKRCSFFPSKTKCHFITLRKSADSCSEQYKYQLKGVLLLFFSIIIVIHLNVHLLQQLQQLIPLSVSREPLSSEWTPELEHLFCSTVQMIPKTQHSIIFFT